MHALPNLFDSASARSLDARACALQADGGWSLMAAAGGSAWQCALQHWPQARQLCVVVGNGNNGGDGWVLATLALQAGRQVQVVTLPGDGPGTALAARAAAGFAAAGGCATVFEGALPAADLLVDALAGLGLRGALTGPAEAAAKALNAHPAPVLALDVPSGIDADHGALPGTAVQAARTLQFIVAHRGLYTGDGLAHAGALQLAPLALPAAAWGDIAPAAQWWRCERLGALLPPRPLNAHKGTSGHVLCVGGNHGSGGALLLAAHAALRAGAGLTSLVTRNAHVSAAIARLPEAMCHGVEDGPVPAPLLRRASVLAIGPGLGQDDWAKGLWRQARDSGTPLVVDADALNLLAAAPCPLHDAVLTPHPGEAARLLDCTTRAVQQDRFAAAGALAARFAAVVVLKGAGTIVAAPGLPPAVIGAGNPGMAVGGMGDLLTGVIAALRAQGLPAFEAAAGGALLHGLAGDAAAADGARGLLPTDLLAPLRRLCNPDLPHA